MLFLLATGCLPRCFDLCPQQHCLALPIRECFVVIVPRIYGAEGDADPEDDGGGSSVFGSPLAEPEGEELDVEGTSSDERSIRTDVAVGKVGGGLEFFFIQLQYVRK